MAIIGVVTNKGLAESVKVSSNQGWSIFPTRFGVSAGSGDLRPTREDTHLMWHQAPITDQTVVSENTIQFVCTIPPQVVETDEHINEIYLFGENSVDNTEFLLAIGQPTETITYFPDGSITLRMHVTLANVQASQVFEFKYTGHRSIEDHNLSVDAHTEVFGALSDQIKSLGESILVENQVFSGGAVYIDHDTSTAQIHDGKFYHNGILYSVPAGSFSVPLSGSVGLGVWVGKDDNDEVTTVWGSRYTPAGKSFHEVHILEDGYLKTKSTGTQLNEPVHTSVTRYDREANGSYIVHGMNVRVTETGNNHYVVQVAEGKAHVNGNEVSQRKIVEKTYNFDPDTERVLAELHRFIPDEKGEMDIMVDNQPIATDQPVKVTYTKSSTLGVERGQVAGTPDFIVPNLLTVKAVRYGTSTFLVNRDFKISGANIDWSPAGSEPPTGSLYTIECEHLREKVIDAIDLYATGLTFSGAIPDTNFHVEYETLLPRKDSIVISQTGELNRIKGKGDTRGLSAPRTPAGSLHIAELTHHWTPGIHPLLANTGVVKIRADDLSEMQSNIENLYELMAEERLARQADGDDPRSKRGIFVDAFLDDGQRDGGAVQTALIDGESQELSLSFDVHTMDTKEFNKDDAPNGIVMLPYSLRVVINQEYATGVMLVNPYSAFAPIPPSMSVTPAIDNWTIQGNTRSTISKTKRRAERVRGALFSRMFGRSSSGRVTRSTNNAVSSRTIKTTELLPHLRELNISFDVKGFKPLETVTSLHFGRNDVTDSLGDYGIKPVTNTLLVGSNSLLDTRPLFMSASDAVLNWRRTSHTPSGNDNTQLAGWSVSDGRIAFPSNSGTLVALTSNDTFDNFDVTVRIRGHNDDDWSGVIIAAVTVGNKTHTLSAMRATRDGRETWKLVKNYRQSDEQVYSSGSGWTPQQTLLQNKGTWASHPDGTTIRVRRKGRIIECWASKFGNRNIELGSRFALDITSTPFVVPSAWGFACFSQASTFEVISQVNNGNQA
jgi:hypothetical protein